MKRMPTLKEVVSAKTIDKALTKYKSAAQHQLSSDAKDYAELLEILVDFFGWRHYTGNTMDWRARNRDSLASAYGGLRWSARCRNTNSVI